MILTVLVFVHEFGHYFIARWNRVRIEVFSIGFGPELFGWWDRAGTRWKFSTIPLGGYVKMFGDSDASSGLPVAGLARLAPAEREVSFHYKRLASAQRSSRPGRWLISCSRSSPGRPVHDLSASPSRRRKSGRCNPGARLSNRGILPGDVIIEIDGRAVERFEDIQQAVRLNPERSDDGRRPAR